MKFRPLHDRVVVKRVEEDTKTKGGIILAPTAVDKEKYATVKGTLIAVGVNAWAEATHKPLLEKKSMGSINDQPIKAALSAMASTLNGLEKAGPERAEAVIYFLKRSSIFFCSSSADC